MKLLRVGTAGRERPALLDPDGTLRDLSGLVTDIDGTLLADEDSSAGSGARPPPATCPRWTRRDCAPGRRSHGSARSCASG